MKAHAMSYPESMWRGGRLRTRYEAEGFFVFSPPPKPEDQYKPWPNALKNYALEILLTGYDGRAIVELIPGRAVEAVGGFYRHVLINDKQRSGKYRTLDGLRTNRDGFPITDRDYLVWDYLTHTGALRHDGFLDFEWASILSMRPPKQIERECRALAVEKYERTTCLFQDALPNPTEPEGLAYWLHEAVGHRAFKLPRGRDPGTRKVQ